jgi:PadR family transcriptional regulator, regulatory protein PadR
MRITVQTLLVLSALLRDPGEWRYGYDLSRETALKSGSLYPLLIRLTDNGWLEGKWRHAEGEKPRHMYRLTAVGQRLGRQAVRARKVPGRLRPVTELG